jgi:hypothetical protein
MTHRTGVLHPFRSRLLLLLAVVIGLNACSDAGPIAPESGVSPVTALASAKSNAPGHDDIKRGWWVSSSRIIEDWISTALLHLGMNEAAVILPNSDWGLATWDVVRSVDVTGFSPSDISFVAEVEATIHYGCYPPGGDDYVERSFDMVWTFSGYVWPQEPMDVHNAREFREWLLSDNNLQPHAMYIPEQVLRDLPDDVVAIITSCV